MGENVDVRHRRTDNNRLGLILLNNLIFAFQLVSLFKFKILGEFGHFRQKMVGNLLRVATEYLLDLDDIFAVFLGRDQSFTTSAAIVDMIVEADFHPALPH